MNPTERASFRTLAQHELDHLHECPVCIGTREDLHEGAPDGTPCQRCGGTGRWDDRAPLARAVITLLDALDAADRKIADLRKEVGRVAPQEMSDWESGLIAREDSEVQEALAEIRRLRAENAALRKVIAEAASLNNSDDIGARRETARILGEALRGGQPT